MPVMVLTKFSAEFLKNITENPKKFSENKFCLKAICILLYLPQRIVKIDGYKNNDKQNL